MFSVPIKNALDAFLSGTVDIPSVETGAAAVGSCVVEHIDEVIPLACARTVEIRWNWAPPAAEEGALRAAFLPRVAKSPGKFFLSMRCIGFW